MKRLLFLMLFVAGVSHADGLATANRSSFTQTNDSAFIAADRIDSVIIGNVSTGGNLTICSSSYTCTGTVVSSISLGTIFTYYFNDAKVSGIFYKTTANTAGVTIIYKK